jgi:GT2 family glycosyltransferase
LYSDIAIVILNYNGKEYLKKFLPTVIRYSENARIVVADNLSTDDSVTYLKSEFPSIEIIQNKSNGGFAMGYNEALRQVDAPYYLLLNSDIEVSENWLSPLYEKIQDPNVSGCQPKVLAYSNKNYFEHAGASGGFLDRNYFPFCRGRIFELTEEDQAQYNNPTEIFWTTGACMLIKSNVFHANKGFDDDFFAHMEEIDLCWRIKRKGGSFWVVPNSKVYHVGGGTLNYMSPFKTYLNFRNSLYTITKNHNGILFSKIFYRMLLDGLAGLLFLVKGSPRHAVAVIQAHVSFYKMLKSILKKRKELKNTNDSFNDKGLYRGSILWARYIKRITKYSDLNHRLFSK